MAVGCREEIGIEGEAQGEREIKLVYGPGRSSGSGDFKSSFVWSSKGKASRLECSNKRSRGEVRRVSLSPFLRLPLISLPNQNLIIQSINYTLVLEFEQQRLVSLVRRHLPNIPLPLVLRQLLPLVLLLPVPVEEVKLDAREQAEVVGDHAQEL